MNLTSRLRTRAAICKARPSLSALESAALFADAATQIDLMEETNLRLQQSVAFLRRQVESLQADNSRLFLGKQHAEETATRLRQDESPL